LHAVVRLPACKPEVRETDMLALVEQGSLGAEEGAQVCPLHAAHHEIEATVGLARVVDRDNLADLPRGRAPSAALSRCVLRASVAVEARLRGHVVISHSRLVRTVVGGT
jgi:hypothetical protein